MALFNRLNKPKNSSESHAQSPQAGETPLLTQALILEPILTPSGLPIDIGTEGEAIEVDDSDFGAIALL
ncbi:MAG: hypothetical protein HC812_11770 [Leptolyngbya sp. RL_3_1]|nr:hypothetical protein [Leptolyngbya sp. RL_3_1]